MHFGQDLSRLSPHTARFARRKLPFRRGRGLPGRPFRTVQPASCYNQVRLSPCCAVYLLVGIDADGIGAHASARRRSAGGQYTVSQVHYPSLSTLKGLPAAKHPLNPQCRDSIVSGTLISESFDTQEDVMPSSDLALMAHLLRRAGFGATKEGARDLRRKGLRRDRRRPRKPGAPPTVRRRHHVALLRRRGVHTLWAAQ